MRLAKSRVHFIGIGGIGMCGLAELLHNMGVKVKGSDLSENQNTIRLRELGIPVTIGQAQENIVDVDVAVFSSAVKPDNPEFKAAKKQGVPLIARAEALAEIMRLKRGVAVGGTHGKTTTTSMTAAIFLHARMDPTIVVGGRLDLIKSTAKLGTGDWMIAEADESDGSFNRLSPEIVIITNIDDDHLDHYKNYDNLERAFLEFASRIPFYGAAIICGDQPEVRKLFQNFPKRILFYGESKENDFQLTGANGTYKILHQDKLFTEFQLQVPGRHNALNALASILAAMQAGVLVEKCVSGIETYKGVDRRLELKSDVHGVLFYDDYGHHPTEVQAVLSAIREKYSKRKVKVLFQPHRYSRTETCWNGFLSCFKESDELFLIDIYAAGEAPIKNISAERLSKEIDHPKAKHFKSKAEAKDYFVENLKSGDIFLTLGAGDVWKLGEEIARDMSLKL
jgi:UDP-N-acetylmuramate--alanine ligase